MKAGTKVKVRFGKRKDATGKISRKKAKMVGFKLVKLDSGEEMEFHELSLEEVK